MEWRWNRLEDGTVLSEGQVLILVLMEWRWNFSNQLKSFNMAVLILVLMEWRWNEQKDETMAGNGLS